MSFVELIVQGVGFHHAGLDNDDRQSVQDLFLNGHLPVLCKFNTLSMFPLFYYLIFHYPLHKIENKSKIV